MSKIGLEIRTFASRRLQQAPNIGRCATCPLLGAAGLPESDIPGCKDYRQEGSGKLSFAYCDREIAAQTQFEVLSWRQLGRRSLGVVGNAIMNNLVASTTYAHGSGGCEGLYSSLPGRLPGYGPNRYGG